MLHLTPSFAIPDWPMSFDPAVATWVLAALVLLGGVPALLPCIEFCLAARGPRGRRHRTATLVVVRPSHARRRRIAGRPEEAKP
jgi:hypothetical protein